MVGIIILSIGFLITYLLNEFTNLKPLININDSKEILPIFTANLFADCLIIYVTFSAIIGRGKPWQILTKWYKKYRLSAVIADTTIGIIYLLIARYVANIIDFNFNLLTFAILAVIIQIAFDFLFYLFFSIIPKNSNDMLDLFKLWGKYAKLDALWGDSILIIVGVILSAYLNQFTFQDNIFIAFVMIYLVPYFIWMKD